MAVSNPGRQEIIKRVAAATGFREADVRTVFDATFDEIAVYIQENQFFILPRIGTITGSLRKVPYHDLQKLHPKIDFLASVNETFAKAGKDSPCFKLDEAHKEEVAKLEAQLKKNTKASVKAREAIKRQEDKQKWQRIIATQDWYLDQDPLVTPVDGQQQEVLLVREGDLCERITVTHDTQEVEHEGVTYVRFPLLDGKLEPFMHVKGMDLVTATTIRNTMIWASHENVRHPHLYVHTGGITERMMAFWRLAEFRRENRRQRAALYQTVADEKSRGLLATDENLPPRSTKRRWVS